MSLSGGALRSALEVPKALEERNLQKQHFAEFDAERQMQRPDIPPADLSGYTVSLTHVSKVYRKTLGLNDITLNLPPGITGLLGDNGSGKSTMLKVMTGLLRPSSGTVRIFGMDPRDNPRIYRRIGYCPEDDAFYPGMTGLDYVTYFLRLNGFELNEAQRRSSIILERLDLADAMDRAIDGYSKGMKQRVKLARAVVTDPDILVLDEPLQGTDPEARHLIIQNLLEWERTGKTIIISSHILREIERLTNNIVLLSRGRIMARGDIHDLRRMMDSHPHSIMLVPRRPEDARRLASALIGQDFVNSAGIENGTDPRDPGRTEIWVKIFTTDPAAFYDNIASVLQDTGIRIRHLSSPDDNLESLYSYLMWGSPQKVI